MAKEGSAIQRAFDAQVDRQKLEQQANKYSLSCLLSHEILVEKMLQRIDDNPNLAKAFLEAKREHVMVRVSGDNFEVHAGYVVVPLKATADEIIKFLLGE